jgi:Uma2 family endonuclease
MTDTLTRTDWVTAEEFYRWCKGEGRSELVEGRIVEMPPVGPMNGSTDVRFVAPLGKFVRRNRLGEVYLNTGFILRRNPDTVRGPDEAFVSNEKIAAHPPPERGYWPVIPDLTVEIVSPDDTPGEVDAKVAEYLDVGVRLVWVLYPRLRHVRVFVPGQPVEVIEPEGTLRGGDVLPGFELPLAEIFD